VEAASASAFIRTAIHERNAMSFSPLRLVMTCLTAASLAASAHAQTIEGKDVCYCYLTDVSDDGLAATGTLNSNAVTFRWTWDGGAKSLGHGTLRHLGITGGSPAISGDGKVVAATIIDSTKTYGTQGRWTKSTDWQQLMPPRPPDGAIVDSFDGNVYGISRDGKVVTGLYWRNTGVGGLAHGSRWTKGGQVEDMGSGGRSSRIDGANADGSVLVGWDEHPDFGIRRAAVWVNGVRTILDDSDWPSEASAVNAAGTIIVGQAIDPLVFIESAVMWTWNGSGWDKKVLGLLPGTQDDGNAYATGVSEDGTTVVGIARLFFTPSRKGFVWTAGTGMVEAGQYLKDKGYNITKRMSVVSIGGISRDGTAMGLIGSENGTGQFLSHVVRGLPTP
jgi:uncharacterized membrane protein